MRHNAKSKSQKQKIFLMSKTANNIDINISIVTVVPSKAFMSNFRFKSLDKKKIMQQKNRQCTQSLMYALP